MGLFRIREAAPSDGDASGTRRAGRHLWQVVAVVVLAAALLVAPQLGLFGPSGDARPEASQQRSSAERPSTENVLRLRDELAAATADSDYPIDPAALASVPTAPGEYTPLGRIRSPVAELEAEFAAGVHPSVLERGPGHWPGTAIPGQPGNAVLSGHRTTHTAPFGELDVLEPGDPVTVDVGGSSTPVVYQVADTTIVPEAEYVDFVLRQPADPAVRQLTLFACHPKGDRTHRIVVRAFAEPAGPPPAVPAVDSDTGGR